MLKVTLLQCSALTLKLEGKIAGPWVDVLRECWNRTAAFSHEGPVQVDLTDVTFSDDAGKDLLKKMAVAGALLVTSDPFIPILLHMDEIEVSMSPLAGRNATTEK